jgi:hypothetical protein
MTSVIFRPDVSRSGDKTSLANLDDFELIDTARSSKLGLNRILSKQARSSLIKQLSSNYAFLPDRNDIEQIAQPTKKNHEPFAYKDESHALINKMEFEELKKKLEIIGNNEYDRRRLEQRLIEVERKTQYLSVFGWIGGGLKLEAGTFINYHDCSSTIV